MEQVAWRSMRGVKIGGGGGGAEDEPARPQGSLWGWRNRLRSQRMIDDLRA